MMNQRIKIMSKLLILCGGMLAVSVPLMAATPIGLVLAVHGKVTAQSANKTKRQLQRRSSIFLKDTIKTTASSRAQIRLTDDSIVSIRPNTTFAITQYRFDSNAPKQNRFVGQLIKGTLINLSGQGKSENYQLKGPLSTISFRGTGVLYSSTPQQERVGIFGDAVQIDSKDKSVVLQHTKQHYQQVSIAPSGRIAPAAGNILTPAPVSTGATFQETKRATTTLKTINKSIAAAKTTTQKQHIAQSHKVQAQEPAQLSHQEEAAYQEPPADTTPPPPAAAPTPAAPPTPPSGDGGGDAVS